MFGRSRRAALAVAAATATAVAGLATLSGPAATGATAAAAKQGDKVLDVQLLSFNDFHGHIQANDPPLPPTQDPSQTPVGGVEYLAAHVDALRSQQKQTTLTVAAGDLIGGSTFISGIFQDQPSIESMNILGLDVSSVGNHEFDEGTDELLRMINGGCHPELGCFEDTEGNEIPYKGAEFDYLGANVIDKATGEPFLPPTSVKKVKGVKIGFIGMTLEATDTLVSPAGVSSVDFVDEVETANAQAEVLQARGVEAIVVLLHEGLNQTGTFGACQGPSGALVGIASEFDPAIDMVVSGHTHQPYICNIPDPNGDPRMVTSAASFGRVLTETHLPIDRSSGDVIREQVTAANHLVSRDITPDPEETELVEFYDAISAPLAGRVVGTLAPNTDIVGDGNITFPCRCAETPMVDLIADAILFGTDGADEGGAQLAFMNIGGVRAPLLYDDITNGEQPGEITYAEAFEVAPFGNLLVTIDMTGQQIYDVLNQQYQAIPARGSRPMLTLGVSEGFSYEWVWDGPAPAPGTQPTVPGHVVPGSAMLNGVPIDLGQTYRVGTINFLASGGDLFTAFTQGTNLLGGPEDLANLVNFFGANPGLTPPPDRVTGL
jgi:5'-nucleotidase